MKKVALYVRVSTKDPNPARGAIAEQAFRMQVSDLRRYAQQRGFEIYNEYVDLEKDGSGFLLHVSIADVAFGVPQKRSRRSYDI